MQPLFINPSEARLRTGWRILLFIILFWTLSATALIIKPLLGEITKKEYVQDYSLIIVSVLAISTTIAVFLGRKFLDKKTLLSLGLQFNRTAVKDLGVGFLLSGLMGLTFFTILLVFGLIQFHGINFNLYPEQEFTTDFISFMSTISLGSLSLILLENILVGYWEEVVFRGYLLQNFAEGMGWVPAIVLSCIIYGLLHAANPNAGLLSTVIIMGFGFLRIYGYLTTKMLWLSMGMHIGWNFFQGPVFGFTASGHEKPRISEITFTSDKSWLTGGEFGPEGSVIIIPILIFTLYIMKLYTKNRHC
ncbi:CPBP family intramembrane glutamic endopeptidase [Robertkochia flava]|uniref:CPBP family intramembrane glutamic endopeptidase n=1 Tax=Robertkochia flava TaxID=3447986 RepID=UPI001CCCB58C|nr:type II CAAX endopeptidase family protein [Robertkochia marina]